MLFPFNCGLVKADFNIIDDSMLGCVDADVLFAVLLDVLLEVLLDVIDCVFLCFLYLTLYKL